MSAVVQSVPARRELNELIDMAVDCRLYFGYVTISLEMGPEFRRDRFNASLVNVMPFKMQNELYTALFNIYYVYTRPECVSFHVYFTTRGTHHNAAGTIDPNLIVGDFKTRILQWFRNFKPVYASGWEGPLHKMVRAHPDGRVGFVSPSGPSILSPNLDAEFMKFVMISPASLMQVRCAVNATRYESGMRFMAIGGKGHQYNAICRTIFIPSLEDRGVDALEGDEVGDIVMTERRRPEIAARAESLMVNMLESLFNMAFPSEATTANSTGEDDDDFYAPTLQDWLLTAIGTALGSRIPVPPQPLPSPPPSRPVPGGKRRQRSDDDGESVASRLVKRKCLEKRIQCG